MFGHEAALFTPSGSMANQIALQLLVPPANELLCDADAHVVTYEMGAAAAIGGISTRTWPAGRRRPRPGDGRRHDPPARLRAVPTRAIAVEQTHNRAGGGGDPAGHAAGAARVGRRGRRRRCTATAPGSGTRTSPTGCRWRPTARSSTRCRSACPRDWARRSARWCCRAPSGSPRRRWIRKRMGGGMRQVGILAAAGRYALAHHIGPVGRRPCPGPPAGRGPGAVRRRSTRPGAHQHRAAGPEPVRPRRARPGGGGPRGRSCWCRCSGPGLARLVTHLDVDDAGHRPAAIEVPDRECCSGLSCYSASGCSMTFCR